VTSLVAVLAPRTGKIIKNGPSVFERRENLLQNDILQFMFTFSQSSEIASKVRISADQKPTFLKGGLALKGLSFY